MNGGRREENRWMAGIRDGGTKWTEGIRDRRKWDGWNKRRRKDGRRKYEIGGTVDRGNKRGNIDEGRKDEGNK